MKDDIKRIEKWEYQGSIYDSFEAAMKEKESRGKTNIVKNKLTAFALRLDDTQKDEYHETDRGLFNFFIDDLAEFLSEDAHSL